MRAPALRTLAALVPVVLALSGAAAPSADLADSPPADSTRLKSLEKDLKDAAAERERLKAQSEQRARDVGILRDQMIALAKDIQDQERALNLMDARIGELTRSGDAMSKTLKDRDAQMGAVLLALERLALHPGDALAFNPLSPDDAIRSAILLRAALPHIQQSEAALHKELAELYK